MIVGGKEGVTVRFGAETTKFNRKLRAVEKGIKSLGKSAVGTFKNVAIGAAAMGAAVAAAMTAISVKSVITAARFEKAFAEVQTIVQGMGWSMSYAKGEITKFAVETGTSLTDATRALYQAASAGFTQQAEALNVVKVAGMAARGGLTDMKTATDAITTSLNAYNMSGYEAEFVSDKLFTTVRLGKTRFEELAGSIGRVMPIASNFVSRTCSRPRCAKRRWSGSICSSGPM